MQANSTAIFTKSIDCKLADLFILKNNNGFQAGISNYGARWISMSIPGKEDNVTNVIAGFDNVEAYTNPSAAYYGATIGRYANRIAKGSFSLDSKEYILDANNGSNHLHGGKGGFHSVVWDIVSISKNSLLLTYFSPDGEEGYPGNLEVFVRYTLTDANEMEIVFSATTDKTTVINLTNHAYFNLNGTGKGDVLNHSLIIHADNYTPIKKTQVPIGNIATVAATPFDFRQPTKIGSRIDDADLQLVYGGGYDHNFVINRKDDGLAIAATVIGDQSNIKMDVLTTEPGIHFYTGNFMDGTNTLSDGSKDDRRTAFCLETQHFPDSPNHKNFPSTKLMPGDTYQSTTVFRFSTDV